MEAYFLFGSLKIVKFLEFRFDFGVFNQLCAIFAFFAGSGHFYFGYGIVRLPKSQAHAWMHTITGEHFA